jgi:beta-lactamase superfamily II metal-dependent hydrolase
MMVDIHHHDDHEEYEHVIDYYKTYFTDDRGRLRPIFRFVSSHPHKDHLKGLNSLFDEINVVNFWDTDHDFAPDQNAFDWEEYKDDWERYEQIRNSTKDPIVLRYTDQTRPAQFWNEDHIEILSPSKELRHFVHFKENGEKRTAEEIGAQLNNLSYVLLIRFNGLKILLAGDAELKTWDYILAHYKEKIRNIDILKAPHHGKDSAFHEEAVKVMNPKHIIFSASTDCENQVPEKYQKAAPRATIYKTCDLGNLIFQCGFDGKITVQ